MPCYVSPRNLYKGNLDSRALKRRPMVIQRSVDVIRKSSDFNFGTNVRSITKTATKENVN